MTTTELSHGAHAVNILIDAIVKAVGEEYEVSEIEGDAVLLIKKGPAPFKKDILDICLKIFNAFHFQRKWMQQHIICPCGACQAIINLSLKFVVHHGPVAEIKVGRFVKQSGPEMIVAHRLLKNSIDNHEYLLITEKLLQQVSDSSDPVEMEWIRSSEEYASIGKIDYHFALLNEARKKVPDPPDPPDYTVSDNSSYLELPIAINFRNVYMVLMNIPDRVEWVPGLLNVEQEIPAVFVGSVHHCTFEHCRIVISPIRVLISDEGIMYAESFKVAEGDYFLILEFVIKRINEKSSSFGWRFFNAGESPLPETTRSAFFDKFKSAAEALKTHCEEKAFSFF